MLYLFQRVFFEKTVERTEQFTDLSPIEALTVLPIIILILVMGIFPQPFIAKVQPTAEQQISAVERVLEMEGTVAENFIKQAKN